LSHIYILIKDARSLEHNVYSFIIVGAGTTVLYLKV